MCRERITLSTGGSDLQELPAVEPTDVHVTVLVKGEERYIFVWRTEQAMEVLRTIGRFASSEQLSLNWFDAARLGKSIQQAAAGSST